MKKFKLLFLVPALFSMAACGLGQEVNADKAKEIAKNMNAEGADTYEATISMTTYDAEEKETTKMNYVLKRNADGDIQASMKAESTGGENEYKSDIEIYKVKNDQYDEVIYMKYYDDEDKKDDINVYVKKGNELSYATIASSVNLELGSLNAYFYDADELVAAIEMAEAEAKKDDNIEIKYYSTGNNNLTIKETAKQSDDDDAYYGESTITFDKGLLTNSESKMQNKAGDKIELKVSIKYPSSLKISLPNGWESYIEK